MSEVLPSKTLISKTLMSEMLISETLMSETLMSEVLVLAILRLKTLFNALKVFFEANGGWRKTPFTISFVSDLHVYSSHTTLMNSCD
jgi:hypothetical protein